MRGLPRGYATGMVGRVLWQGLLSGLVGTAAMTVAEKAEQRWSGRPDSYVPARTLERLVGARERPHEQPRPVNLAMHYGQGAVLGVLRSAMAHAGLRGPYASTMFTMVRFTNDQLLENATGVGAPPQTWPRRELAADLLHKTVYGFATGIVADVLAARTGAGPGQWHAAKLPGRHSDVGPAPRESARARLTRRHS